MNPRDRKLRLRKTTLRSLDAELASNIRGGGSFIICPRLETGQDSVYGTCDTCAATCIPTCQITCEMTCLSQCGNC